MSFDLLVLPPQDETARRWARRLASELPEVKVIVASDEADAAEVLAGGARAAYGTMTPALLRHARDLVWLQAPMAAPPAGYFFEELATHPVVVTNLRGTYTDHVATHGVALLYAMARNLPFYWRRQSERRWDPDKDESTVLHLQEATVLIVGVGGLGEEIGRQLHPLGCEIVGIDARREEAPAEFAALHRPEHLDELLPEADAVMITVPHTPATFRLFEERRFGLMKSSALLVNIGRGAVVDVDHLARALAEGSIRAAALDVFPEEPLPEAHPLWTLPNAILTPHVAAVGPFADDRRYGVLRENAERFDQGQELINVVDKAAWY